MWTLFNSPIHRPALLRTVIFTDVETVAESYITLPSGDRQVPDPVPPAVVGKGGIPQIAFEWDSVRFDDVKYDLAVGTVFLLETNSDTPLITQLPIPIRKLRDRTATEEIQSLAARADVKAFLEEGDG